MPGTQLPAQVLHSTRVGALGRDVVLLANADGSAPRQALAAYDPAAARIATPLAFFAYGPAAVPFVAAQLHQPAAYRWDEYTYLKPMELVAGSVVVLPLSHLYDKLRPLPHWERGRRTPSKSTVHVTLGFK